MTGNDRTQEWRTTADLHMLALNYARISPTPGQREIVNDYSLNKVIVGGVRSGKTTSGVQEGIRWIIADYYYGRAVSGSEYWLVGETYDLTKMEFNGLAEALTRLDPGMVQSIRQLSTGRPGTINLYSGGDKPVSIHTKSARDTRALASVAPLGLMLCEAGLANVDVWMKLHERALELQSPIFISGTLEWSDGWYPELIIRCKNPEIQRRELIKTFTLPSFSNTVVFPLGERDPKFVRFKAQFTGDRYHERILGEPRPVQGRVHPASAMAHIRDIEYVEGEPVYLASDPGFSSKTDSAAAILCTQLINGKLHIFDEIYEQEVQWIHVVEKLMRRPWWRKVKKGEMGGVIDQAGSFQTGVSSFYDQFLTLTGVVLNYQKVSLIEGIDLVNTLLHTDAISGESQIAIAPRCKGILSESGIGPYPFEGHFQGERSNEIRAYVYQIKRDGTTAAAPRNKYNHAWSAIRYLVWDLFAQKKVTPGGDRVKRRRTSRSFNPFGRNGRR